MKIYIFLISFKNDDDYYLDNFKMTIIIIAEIILNFKQSMREYN